MQTSSDDNAFEYEHSRSSSVGDIHWPEARVATPDGHAALPYDALQLPYRKLVMSNGHVARGRRPAFHGAVRVDLSFADKSIRRPGSAPDLVNNADNMANGGMENYSLRDSKQVAALKSRGRSTSSDKPRSTSSERDSVMKKAGVSPATRKVAFAGIEDDEDSDTETEKEVVSGGRDEVVWVKQPDILRRSMKDPLAAAAPALLTGRPQPGAR
jgi:hypothetical protein